MSERLVLGTAQFGLPYGISNTKGQVSPDEIARILAIAWENGVRTLDTAMAYGDSETRIGSAGASGWRVVTKLPHIDATGRALRAEIERQVRGSLQRLRADSVYGLLLHRSGDLIGADGAAWYDALVSLKQGGLVEKIGVSIYDPEELDALSGRYSLDLVQAPFNVFDRRLASSGWLDRLKRAGVEVHARSAFLQGLLLMSNDRRPAKFARWQSLWSAWDAWIANAGVTPLVACIQFVLSHPQVDGAVVGVESAGQLGEILRAVAGTATVPPVALSTNDPDLINPSRWDTV